MATTDTVLVESLQNRCPHTFNALQSLVMAMADLTKNAGKRTFFGRDKGVKAYAKFLQALKMTIYSMVLDGAIRESTSADQLIHELELNLARFAIAFPNWPEAYGFAATFFGENRKDALATIERLRSTP